MSGGNLVKHRRLTKKVAFTLNIMVKWVGEVAVTGCERTSSSVLNFGKKNKYYFYSEFLLVCAVACINITRIPLDLFRNNSYSRIVIGLAP